MAMMLQSNTRLVFDTIMYLAMRMTLFDRILICVNVLLFIAIFHIVVYKINIKTQQQQTTPSKQTIQPLIVFDVRFGESLINQPKDYETKDTRKFIGEPQTYPTR